MTARTTALDVLAIQQDALKFAEQMLSDNEEENTQGGGMRGSYYLPIKLRTVKRQRTT